MDLSRSATETGQAPSSADSGNSSYSASSTDSNRSDSFLTPELEFIIREISNASKSATAVCPNCNFK